MRIRHQYRIFILVLLNISITGFAQNKTPGFARDARTYVPIEGVTIHYGKEVVAANELGRFSLEQINETDSLTISAIGYEPKKISYADLVKNNNIILLDSRIIELSSVTVALPAGDQYKPISKLDIQRKDISNSQEILRLVPGLFIGQHAGGGKAEQIFLRGFDIDHGTDINITADGMPVNMVSHAHGQGYADLHFLIPELVENVSFKKGSYYAEKGNLATAGYVDFRTKNVLSNNMVKLEAGQFNTWRAVGMVSLLDQKAKEKNQSAFLATEYMHTKGYFDNPQNFNRWNLFAKYYGKITPNTNLSFSASSFSSKWKASGQIPERAFQNGLIGFFGAIDPNEGGNTSRSNLNAQLQTS